MARTRRHKWLIHTPSLLTEVLVNKDCAIFKIPFRMLGLMLAEVATRASELNDPELNALMCQLTLYEVADPYSKAYDPKVLKQVERAAERAKKKKQR